MKTTKHCNIRMQQRGISDLEIELVSLFGKQDFLGNSVFQISLGKKEKQKLVKKLRKIVEKLEGNQDARLIAVDEKVITTYRPTKRWPRDRKQRKYPRHFEEYTINPIYARGCVESAVVL